MSQKPISELRHRMLEDMVVRRLGEKTKSDYIRHIENFTAFLGRSPDTATARAPFPGSFDRDWGGTVVNQPDGHGAAFFFWYHP